MDDNEIVRRLDAVRERIRDHLADVAPPRLGDALPPEQALELGEPLRNYTVPAEPNLNSSPHLESANAQAAITRPIELTSTVPLLGPVLTLLRRLGRPFVQPLIDPYLDRQERFNVEVVRHLNDLGQRLEKRLDNLGAELGHWIADPGFIEARLDAALTDYDEALKARHTVLFDALEEELVALRAVARDYQAAASGNLHALEVRFVERAQAVDARFEEKDRAMEAALRTAANTADTPLAEAELLSTRAELRRVLDAVTGACAEAPERVRTDGNVADDWSRLARWLEGEEYRAFQDRFRGNEAEISARMREHVREFRGLPGLVADLGCGRGEFLDLLHEAGVPCEGVETNQAEVAEGRRRGHTVNHADLFDWLEARAPESLGGIFLAQVIEHLAPPTWCRFVELAATRLAPGGRLVIETINPESWYAFSRAYLLDPTHVRPAHPELVRFMAARAGLVKIAVRYQAAVPLTEQLEPIDAGEIRDPRLAQIVSELNGRLRAVNNLLCAPQEYALVASRPERGAGKS